MVARTANGKAKKTEGLTVAFAPEEKRLLRRAAVEAGVRSTGHFIREAAVKEATKVIGRALKAAA